MLKNLKIVELRHLVIRAKAVADCAVLAFDESLSITRLSKKAKDLVESKFEAQLDTFQGHFEQIRKRVDAEAGAMAAKKRRERVSELARVKEKKAGNSNGFDADVYELEMKRMLYGKLMSEDAAMAELTEKETEINNTVLAFDFEPIPVDMQAIDIEKFPQEISVSYRSGDMKISPYRAFMSLFEEGYLVEAEEEPEEVAPVQNKKVKAR